MAMLAEPKKKKRVILNPRGTLWTKDENKFGQKLLEKMGWSKGKGLGKDEQGMQEPIHASGNSDNKGVGFKGNPEVWTQHYQDFEDVLSSLNSANNSEGSNSDIEKESDLLKNVESLEIKSKSSRARLHYSKFTRGKDLSRYNEDDLACVLGSKKKVLKGKDNEKIDEKQKEGNKETKEEETDKKDTFTYYNGNLKDYFNQKMEELKLKRREGLLGDEHTPSREKKLLPSTPGTPFPDLEFEPAKTDFSFNLSVQEPDLKPEVDQDKKIEADDVGGEELTEKKKKHKKNKKSKNKEKESNIEFCEEITNADNELIKENIEDEIDSKKHKKSMRKFKTENTEEGNISTESETKKEKKKKKKKNIKEEGEISSNICKLEDSQMENNPELNINNIQLNNCTMNESYLKATSTEEKKKDKKRKKSNEDIFEDKENTSSISKPFKKLKKLASEISLPEALKSSSEKIDNENNTNCEVENEISSDNKPEEERPNIQVKLKSKRSFKELKSEFEAKVKEKIKKKSKTELLTIEEEQESSTTITNTTEKTKKKSGSKNSTVLILNVPVTKTEFSSIRPKELRTVAFDVEKAFPGSNLHTIEGYYKNKNK